MSEPVLDASAVLALLNSEPGHEVVSAVLPAALLSAINLAEVVSKLCERGAPPDIAAEAVRCLGVEIIPYTDGHAVRTGELRSLTKPFGLSLGDRACLSLGWERRAVVITADRAWNDRVEAATGVKILRIRNGSSS
ncbi:type II toxin-antitoxin system VapC family toxin [Skermanella rosea]|uniref:type II toxin-antitoxin system VapC family toxin n=1 Tax=Skermanella rosea TaxID=1817965 RepID=UPI0019329AE0|nr:type II toxin-antitoxin system VapC family toxin [Skermanella rosea]UEM02775.1 type II toxin-antitoxin system VapC family toxin [Skermanella rosea]